MDEVQELTETSRGEGGFKYWSEIDLIFRLKNLKICNNLLNFQSFNLSKKKHENNCSYGWTISPSPAYITIPKPLIPIAGKPIVHRLVEDIAGVLNQEIEEVAFIIHETLVVK
jgi:hypothetical protein